MAFKGPGNVDYVPTSEDPLMIVAPSFAAARAVANANGLSGYEWSPARSASWLGIHSDESVSGQAILEFGGQGGRPTGVTAMLATKRGQGKVRDITEV